jgi:hypothetical protein
MTHNLSFRYHADMTTKGLGLRLGWRIQINIRCDGKNISQLGNGTPAAMVRARNPNH